MIFKVKMNTSGVIQKWVPGLRLVRTYQREWLRSDLLAGLSIAAVALPIGIAYAQLGGFPPVVGIYSCILPAVAYAIFGSSRQLVVNPDAAACAIVAATVAPMALGDATRYADLSIALTLVTGLLCLAGGIIGLGTIANFLSRPILTGYLNGIALTIIVGQLGTLLGFKVPAGGFFRTVAGVVSRLSQTHLPTLAVGLSLFVLLLVLKRVAPKVPGPLIAAALGCVVVYFLGLQQRGVAVVGAVPSGLPVPHIPSIGLDDVWPIIFGACGIMLVSFCSMMTTARGFAAKNGYSINVNQDMFALGMSDIASAFSRGFVVSGADSRTAVADSSGGKSQVATIVAAAAMLLVLLFLTVPLASLPASALAAILISSAFGLFDISSLIGYYRISKPEFRHSMVAMLGVMTAGVLPGVLVAVALAMLHLLRMASRPHDQALGLADANNENDLIYGDLEAEGPKIPGLTIYRFEASLLFFNADHFTERVRSLTGNAETRPDWFILDAESIPVLDITGAFALDSLRSELASKGIVFGIARMRAVFQMMLEGSGVANGMGTKNLYATIHDGARAYLAQRRPAVEVETAEVVSQQAQ